MTKRRKHSALVIDEPEPQQEAVAVEEPKEEPLAPTPPMGGTELILGHLKAAFPELTEKVQIIMSRPEQVTLEDKPRILWLQDLPQDPGSAPLKDNTYRSNFNAIVFASHWQQAMYNFVLGIPYAQGMVIKNAVPLIDVQLPKPKDKLKFIYTSTPHRGLVILAEAARRLAEIRQDWELDVYSSLKIYGWNEQDKQFKPMYDVLRANPCVNYYGSVPNAEVREAVKNAHVFVYPSVYMETSCMAVQEALMAGCLCITSNFGALPETCGEWAWMYQFDERPDVMVSRTLNSMIKALDEYDSNAVQMTLPMQQLYYQRFYSFESRLDQWKMLLEHVASQPAAEPMFVVE
jgi:UDP-glucose:(glucosyl)LPS alpha-1,2-glucosyltransferase